MTTAPNPRRGRLRLTLGRKAGALFLLLALLLVGMAAMGVVQLAAVALDAERFLEESREDQAAHQMLAAIEQLQLVAQLPAGAVQPPAVARLLGRVRAELDALDPEARAVADPSTREHASAERVLFDGIRAGLDRLDLLHASGEGPSMELLWQMQEDVADLNQETDEALRAATADLRRRVDRLVTVMVGTAVAAILVLLGLHAMTRRQVVLPVETLRRGASSFGSGHLEHRIRIDSTDEVGDLAEEFNRMADSLTETQRDLERRVRDRTAELIRTARLADLGTFAAGVAHEVNTPLASIASCAEGLERRVRAGTATSEEQVEYLQTIAREAYRARDITSRLLALARQDAGPAMPCDLRESIANVARLFGHDMTTRGISLATDVAEDLPCVEANPAEIDQLLLNLVKNAMDASPRGGGISLRCRADGDRVTLEVEDEGPGIPESRREAVFEPFYTTKRPGEGTGLGLALVHRIVEAHRGSIEIATGAKGGALVRVRLPASSAQSGEAA